MDITVKHWCKPADGKENPELWLWTEHNLFPSIYMITVIDKHSTLCFHWALRGLVLTKWTLWMRDYESQTVTPLQTASLCSASTRTESYCDVVYVQLFLYSCVGVELERHRNEYKNSEMSWQQFRFISFLWMWFWLHEAGSEVNTVEHLSKYSWIRSRVPQKYVSKFMGCILGRVGRK